MLYITNMVQAMNLVQQCKYEWTYEYQICILLNTQSTCHHGHTFDMNRPCSIYERVSGSCHHEIRDITASLLIGKGTIWHNMAMELHISVPIVNVNI